MHRMMVDVRPRDGDCWGIDCCMFLYHNSFLNSLYGITCFTLVSYVTLCLLYAFLYTVHLFVLCACSPVILDAADDE